MSLYLCPKPERPLFFSAKCKNASKNRDIFAKQMTPADISAAQKLALECVRKKYKGVVLGNLYDPNAR